MSEAGELVASVTGWLLSGFSKSEWTPHSLFPQVIPADFPSGIQFKMGAEIYFPGGTGLLPFSSSTVLVHPRINSTHRR